MPGDNKPLKPILDTYQKAVRNYPLLRYSWVLVATACILALIAYFKLRNSDVFFYAFVVIFISFIGFLLSSFKDKKDPYKNFLLNFLITCLVITMATGILGFGSFMVCQRPNFFVRWFPAVDTAQSHPVPHVHDTVTVVKTDTMKSIKKDLVKIHPTKTSSTPDFAFPEADIQGRVTDEQDQPLKGARIYYRGNLLATTDDNGSFSVAHRRFAEDNILVDVSWVQKHTQKTIGIFQTDVLIKL